MCLISVAGMTSFLFLVGALTKGMPDLPFPFPPFEPPSHFFLTVYGGSGNTSGIYGTVATIFLFQGSYAVGITPLTLLYPPEVLNFSIRSNGMAAWTLAVTCGG